MKNKTLGAKGKDGLILPLDSNHLPWCLHCKVEITEENDSGWEAFTEDGITTQKICKECFNKMEKELPGTIIKD